MKLHVIYDSENKILNVYSDNGKLVEHLVTDQPMDLVIRPDCMIFQQPEFEGDDRNEPSGCDHGCDPCDHCGSCGCDDPQCCGTHIAPCILLEAGIDPGSVLEIRPGEGCLTIVLNTSTSDQAFLWADVAGVGRVPPHHLPEQYPARPLVLAYWVDVVTDDGVHLQTELSPWTYRLLLRRSLDQIAEKAQRDEEDKIK